ncbi:MAG: subclass B3 metallo-beta-lactamase [Pseudomonadota bacterium]
MDSISRLLVVALLLCLFCTGCRTVAFPETNADAVDRWLAECGEWDDWDKPAPPFLIHENTYYVGTCGISVILVTTKAGHFLIDSGTRQGAEHVVRNIESLGFRVEDVNVLLHSHEHFDHVGGIHYLQTLSGAKLLASGAAASVLASGLAATRDPQFGLHDPFEGATVSGLVVPGRPVTLGQMSLMPVATPGHTPGALSWQWQSCDSRGCLDIVYADSLSPIGRDDYRFSADSAYVDAFRKGLRRLAALDCDFLLTPHPSASRMVRRLRSGTLWDPTACQNYAESIRTRLNKRLQDERSNPQAKRPIAAAARPGFSVD